MAIEITSDTVVKIIVRRGIDSERTSVLFSEGELGYAVDTKRLFVGDGYTLGGTPVGSINFGVVDNLNYYSSLMLHGDFAYNNNTLYFRNQNLTIPVRPVPYTDTQTPSFPTLEYSPDPVNGLRFGLSGFGAGFVIDYSAGGTGNIANAIEKAYSQVNFDARYISLCAAANSWYFGNIFNRQVSNNEDATVNISRNLFINDINSNPLQLQLYAKDPYGAYNSLIQCTNGKLVIQGTALGLATKSTEWISVSSSGFTRFTGALGRTVPVSKGGNFTLGATENWV